jgi:hypothetical protein
MMPAHDMLVSDARICFSLASSPICGGSMPVSPGLLLKSSSCNPYASLQQ